MPTASTKTEGSMGTEAGAESYPQEPRPFVVAAASTPIAMAFTDASIPGNPIVFANDSFLALTGYSREDVLGRGLDILGPLDPGSSPPLHDASPHGAGRHRPTPCLRKDGSTFWAEVIVSPAKDQDGVVVEHFTTFVDLTWHKNEEERLHFLLDELKHRTQNTLATVQAIATQTLRESTNQDVLDAFQARILALSKGHNLMERASTDAIGLRAAITPILKPFGLGDKQAGRFSIHGGRARLQPKIALSLAMVFHELATNAAKYGALSADARGHIDISWTIRDIAGGRRLKLLWRETGGPAVIPPERKGFGSRLIESLAKDLNGEVRVDYAEGGVVCEITMTLPPAEAE